MKRTFSNFLISTTTIFLLAFHPAKSMAQNMLLDSLTLDTLTGFTSLEEALKNPEEVIKLTLKRKKYKTFPDEIFKFTNLQYLDISKNDIETIPSTIGELKNLQYFSISKNKLKEFPYEIGKLDKLVYLNGSRNNLYNLPTSIGKLTSLKHLDLWDNYLDMFPEEIKNCSNLKTVDMRNILISQKKQDQMQAMLRHTKIHFSPACQCEQ